MRLEHWFYTIPLRLRSLFRRSQMEHELDEEMQIHLEQRMAQEMERGKTSEEARYAALRAMGGLEQSKEGCRDTRGVRWLNDLIQDAAYGIRTLGKTPGFTIVATLVLTLGIGANTAVFTIVNQVLLRPLPYQEPDRLFLISNVPKQLAFDPGPIMIDRDYLQLRRYDHLFEGLSIIDNARGGRKMTLTKQGEPTMLSASIVGPDLLRILRVQPALGRAFLGDGKSDPNVVLLSHHLWMSRLGGDPKAIGRALTLDGVSYGIVGVMPETFNFENADVWIRDQMKTDPGNVFFLPVLGRLKPGVSQAEAQAELATFAANLSHDGGWWSKEGYITRVVPLKELFVGDVRKLLLIFAGAVAFVFLIACANYANLLLIRGAGRQPEIAVRAALGASRGRLVRQLMTESLLLSLFGATLGVMFSAVGVRAIVGLLPADRIPPAAELHLDGWVLLFTFALSLITGLVFGLAPALQAMRRELREGVSEGGRSIVTRRERLRGTLVAIEMALALVLLTGAGLMTKSFLQMRSVNPGFRSNNLTVATFDLPEASYQTAAQMREFDRRVLSSLGSLPGLSSLRGASSVAAVSFLPFGSGVMGDFKLSDGRYLREGIQVDKPAVSADYFRVMEIPLISGRVFSERDDLAAPGVVVISQSVARRLWPSGHVIGQRISMEDHPKPEDWLTIVGVVSDVRQGGIKDKQAAVLYLPILQIRMPGFISHISFVVRSQNEIAAANAIRTGIRKVDPDLPTETITTMDAVVADSMVGTRSQTSLLGIFSVMALLLASIGIYGVLSCSVAERTHEIGIRMALGAEQKDILWMVIRRTLVLAASGALIGTLGAVAVTGVLKKFLFEVAPNDPTTFCVVTAILLLVALFSAWQPARRAAHVYPSIALRHE